MRKKVRDTIVVFAWAATMTLVLVRASYEPTKFSIGSITLFDLLAILTLSIVAGIILVDPKTILFGYIASISLTILISIIFASLFDWYVLGMKDILSGLPFAFDRVFARAAARVFGVAFPMAIVLSFFGVYIGGFVNGIIWPQRGY